jgi:hypothetical protein
LTNKYRSKFEKNVAASLRKNKIKFGYETRTLRFVQPAKARKYRPDFELQGTSFVVECKGKLTAQDRTKLEWAQAQNPDVPIVILFMRSRNYLRKGSKTTYSDWATKAGFRWFCWEQDKERFLKWTNQQQQKETA